MEALELEGVVKHFSVSGERVRAVDGVSLTASWGEMVALTGPSGSGKSTLLLLTGGLLQPDAGTIRFEGDALAGMSEARRAEYLQREVGFVYQRFPLLPRIRAIENAAVKLVLGGMGMRQAQAQALPWLERVGLGDRLEHTPERLSGGERQRLAIARALAARPRLILADEPTGSLDSTRSREVVDLLHEVAHERGATVLLVTHDEEAAALADRRYSLRDGRLQPPKPADLEEDREVSLEVVADGDAANGEARRRGDPAETARGPARSSEQTGPFSSTAREG